MVIGMNNVVITIARQYGSGGRTIGEMLAKKLNVHYYDKELMKLASDDSGINEALFVNADAPSKQRLLPQRYADPSTPAVQWSFCPVWLLPLHYPKMRSWTIVPFLYTKTRALTRHLYYNPKSWKRQGIFRDFPSFSFTFFEGNAFLPCTNLFISIIIQIF